MNQTERKKALKLLKKALKDKDLFYAIKERATIRWADGLSGTLLDAAAIMIGAELNESPKRDENGKIILQSFTDKDWENEIKELFKKNHEGTQN